MIPGLKYQNLDKEEHIIIFLHNIPSRLTMYYADDYCNVFNVMYKQNEYNIITVCLLRYALPTTLNCTKYWILLLGTSIS